MKINTKTIPTINTLGADAHVMVAAASTGKLQKIALSEFSEAQTPSTPITSSAFTELIINLTPEEIRTLGTNPYPLVPGEVGKYLELDKIVFEYNHTSGFAYTDMVGDFFEIRTVTDDVLSRVSGQLVTTALDKVAVVSDFKDTDLGLTFTPIYTPGTGLYLGTYNYNDLTDNGQTGTLRLKIYYKYVTLGA